MSTRDPSPTHAAPDPLPGQWKKALEDQRCASCSRYLDRVVVLEETSSTQDAARAQAASGERVLVVAHRQTHGRGRLGRLWEDTGDKGVSMSFALTLSRELQQRVSLLSAVAAADAVEAALHMRAGQPCDSKHLPDTLAVKIRWPNDIMVPVCGAANPEQSMAKVAGILIEQIDTCTIIGVGINVSQQLEDWPDTLRGHAISLHQAGCDIDRLKVACLLMDSLCGWLDKSAQETRRAFGSRDCLCGTTRTFLYDNQRFVGKVKAIDPSNAIVLVLEDGSEVRLPAQGTSLEPSA